ncbi:unnamed protein product [Phytophthora lilii]|uniref:Unnamed protein product n=1 Tax=Phytophthora lilii TaxID=2077276 RepID=A0A9W6X485_9STRA|nr:unnamed protein product [Phytophthora lilii]
MALKSRQQWRKDCRQTLRHLNERESNCCSIDQRSPSSNWSASTRTRDQASIGCAVKTVEHVDAARTETVKDIMGELEQRAIGAGVVTFDGLDTALKELEQAC